MSTQETFDFPEDLVAAQRALEAARAARAEFLASVPVWTEPQPEMVLKDGVVPGGEGWSEEQKAENRQLLEAEQQASHAVSTHPFWEALRDEDHERARTELERLGAG
ncbi:hypothetical protein [Kitasatospora cheerisanensis]|uniref:hypothetical protein n=1 Tax=Kitasatospora cheerisanensis TaxID=81942 RepID=UPI000568CEBF|nr:hypothetical protein [Kitasatospora cheerisanensis]